MTSLCTQYYQFFLAQAMLFGFGVAGLFLPSFATMALYFKKHRGLALGITIGGSSIGGVVWPIALRRLLIDIGFPWTMRVAGFIMMPLFILGILTVRPPIAAKSDAPKPKPNVEQMKTVEFGLLAAFQFFAAMGMFIPFFYITSYSISIGQDPDMSFYLVAILNGVSLVGRVLPGFIADRYGTFNMITVVTFFSGIICCCMTSATSMGGLIAIAAAYGLSSGAILSLQGACSTKLVGPESYGAAMGAMMGVCSIAYVVRHRAVSICSRVIQRSYRNANRRSACYQVRIHCSRAIRRRFVVACLVLCACVEAEAEWESFRGYLICWKMGQRNVVDVSVLGLLSLWLGIARRSL
jgi:MFS family permease